MLDFLRYLLRFKLFAIDSLNVIFLLILTLIYNYWFSIWIPFYLKTQNQPECAFLKKEALIKVLPERLLCTTMFYYVISLFYM